MRLDSASFCSSTVAKSGSSFRTRPSSSIMTAGRLPSEGLARYRSSPAFDMPKDEAMALSGSSRIGKGRPSRSTQLRLESWS